MIVEPVMKYEDVVLMFEFLDDFDAQTLLAIVNNMSSERASVANAVAKERAAQLTELRSEMAGTI